MINKIGLILGFIGLALSVLWGYMYYRNKSIHEELMRKANEALASIEQDAKLKQDSILLEIKRRDSAIGSLTLAQKQAKESLNAAVREGKKLSADLRKAKVDKDTSTYYAKCDSLSDQLIVVEAENASYQQKVDSLNSKFQQQLCSKDSMMRVKDELYSKLRVSFVGSTLKVDDLSKENRKLELKLERSKRTTRLVALVGAAVAGTVYLSTR